MEKKMFFGKKLKDLRIRKMGIHKFKEAMGTSFNVTELYEIEHGYAKPPESIMFLQQLILALDISPQSEDWLELIQLYRMPFVMQKMPTGLIPSPLTAKTDGTQLNKNEFIDLCKYINSVSENHNIKADVYNKEHGVE
jgi:hypothetical protein